jgi:enterochelin esterase-like enzyme
MAAILATPTSTLAAEGYTPFEGEKSTWHDGFDRYDFVMDERDLSIVPFKRPDGEGFAVRPPEKGRRRCVVVVPKQPAAGNPWSWRGQYWDHEPQTEVELLRRGFHVVYVSPDPGKEWDAWYDHLTGKHGLSRKPAFIGMSKGGVNAYDWATAHPDQVSCIYADNPAIRPAAFAKLGDLARNDVALLNVCGSADFLLERHTLAIEARYQQLGGRITVIIKDGQAHHPHSLRDPKPLADWVEEHVRPSPGRPDFADASFVRSSYYSLASAYNEFPRERTYATCRGPGFVDCYDRYDARTESQWGLTGMAVVVPKTAAAGKPWVFRADPIARDAAVDQALLARGFHIVVAPLTAQSGAVREQWDAVYKRLVDLGFSRKPVLEGAGTAAGEAYAWAVENPDKLSCLYAENPALRSLMSKATLLDRLEPLVRAGVPLIHACGSLDPWLESQTRAAEKRYRELGGTMHVLIDDGRGHMPTSPRDPSRVVELILARQTSTQAGATARGDAGSGALAQPGRAARVVSPEVHPDRTVTFRLRAPDAKAVTVQGDLGEPRPLSKADDGLWTVTVGPLKADLYQYWFNVEGLHVVDPGNRDLKDPRTSLVVVPGDPPSLVDRVPGRHGRVTMHWYDSRPAGVTRRVCVYTPPGYEPSTDSYPVLYLLHGSGDDETAWMTSGRATTIADNLLAQGKAVPALIVMPYGHVPRAASPAGAAPGAERARTARLFEEDLLQEVVPLVEASYRVHKDPAHRAIAGLSMGGGQSASIGLNHPELFGYVGVWSSGLSTEPETTFRNLLARSDQSRNHLKLLWIGCGRQDRIFPNAERLSGWMTEHGVKNVWRPSEGPHEWPVWRLYLGEFLPRLFR